LWLEGAFKYLTLNAVRTAEFSQALAPKTSQKDNSIKAASIPPCGGARKPSSYY